MTKQFKPKGFPLFHSPFQFSIELALTSYLSEWIALPRFEERELARLNPKSTIRAFESNEFQLKNQTLGR